MMHVTILLSLMLIPWNLMAATDPYLWLEAIESPEAMTWVKAHNGKSLPKLMNDVRYGQFEKEVREILLAKDRIPSPSLRNGWIYNFWQDATYVRGIFRRTRIEEYKKASPNWETILDLDALAKAENENWVWKSSSCLPPKYERCLLSLSRGGKDAVVVREFDIATKSFVKNGFQLPEAKSQMSWKDEDQVFVGTDFGAGSLTASGYPRIVKLWKRGTPLSEAKQIFEGQDTDVSVYGYTVFQEEGNVSFVGRSPSFFTQENYLLTEDMKPIKVALPVEINGSGTYNSSLLVSLRKDWGRFASGSLLAVPFSAIGQENFEAQVELVYEPDSRSTLSGIAATRSALYLNVLQNVQGKLFKVSKEKGKWEKRVVEFPEAGVITVLSTDDFDDRWLVNYQGFLTPPSVYLIDAQGKSEILRQLPAKFDAKDMVVVQNEAASKDGVKIPYFMIHKKNIQLNGQNPTNLTGYGGFQISSTPYYLNETGKVWIERGGVHVVANIRGGGEFGPKWHQAALLENRQKAFDDFIAVAEDLIKRGITSPKKLGIEGGSNGGLLVGATFTQRPDLFNAVICQVPLLDMLRFHKLLAGHSWTAEYGNPEDPKMAEVISKYSPYQNVKPAVRYPKVYFTTSTKDDRVHPGHARKMVARMEELGHEVLYYENIEGGHGGAANLEQRIKNQTLEFTYLTQQLVD
jgi:prolyl oligopeptidase